MRRPGEDRGPRPSHVRSSTRRFVDPVAQVGPTPSAGSSSSDSSTEGYPSSSQLAVSGIQTSLSSNLIHRPSRGPASAEAVLARPDSANMDVPSRRSKDMTRQSVGAATGDLPRMTTSSEMIELDQPTFASYFESEIRELEANLENQNLARTTGEPSSRLDVTRQYNGHMKGMEFWHIDHDGKCSRRQLSRTGLLREARSGFEGKLPNAKKIGSWLVDVDSGPERRELQRKMGYKPGKKGERQMLKRYLKSALRIRDIRQVDPAFSAKSCLWVRHSALVVAIEGVRAIICFDKVFLFNPDSEKALSTRHILQQRVRQDSDVEDAFVPFELRALEGILVSVVTGLEDDFVTIEPQLEENLLELPRRLNSSALEDLRIHQQTLSHFVSRLEKVQRVLQEVLDDDEDMSKMYLTEKQKNPDMVRHDHDEVEALIEAYMQVVGDLATRAELLDQSIEDTEDLVGIHLDTLRNKLLMVQLSLGIIGMMLTFGSLVAGFFGMNLEISIYESASSEWWFTGVAVTTIVVVCGASFGIHIFLRRLGLYTPV